MKRPAVFLLCALLLCSIPSCSAGEMQTETFYLMDTVITVTLYTSDVKLAEERFAVCKELLSELENLWSRHGGTGDIARLNASETGIENPDPRTSALLVCAQEIAARTDGAFDITLAALSDLWQTCGEENRLPAEGELSALLALTGTERLEIRGNGIGKPEGMQIDLGAIGKGAAVTLLTERLAASGIPGGLISFGSNVAVFGSKPDKTPFRIALRDPKDAGGTVGTLTLSPGEILSVSGDYERFVTVNGEKYHHILNPVTGYPAASGLSSVAVISSDGAVADALSTALFVMGYDAAMDFYRAEYYAFEAIFITSGGEILTTPGITDFTPQPQPGETEISSFEEY